MTQKWLPEGNGITRTSFAKTKLGQTRTNIHYCLQRQWCSQPDNLVPLCKFQIIIIIDLFKNWLFLQSMDLTIFA